MDNRNISPEEAMAELARRELARRGQQIEWKSPLSGFEPSELAQNLGVGLAKTIGDIGGTLANKVPNNPIFNSFAPIQLSRKIQEAAQSASNKLAPSNENLSDRIAQFLGEQIPVVAGGEVAELGKPISGIEKLAGGAQHGLGGQLAKYLSIIGKNAAFGGGAAGLTGGSPLSGAVSGGVGAGILPIVGSEAVNKLRPSNLLRGNLTPEELMNNLELTKGTETNLGDVINNPLLKDIFENTLPSYPFSGANQAMQRTGAKVLSQGEGILSNMLGAENPNKISEQLTDELIKQHGIQKSAKSNLYTEFNNLADEIGETPSLDKFTDALKRNKNVISNMSILRNDPLGSMLFDKVSDATGALHDESTRLPATTLTPEALPYKTIPSYKEANMLKGRLNTAARLAGSSPDASQRAMANVYQDLGKSLTNDVRESVKNSGHEGLQSAYKTAEENYANKYSPFLDKDIYKFISGNKNPETLISSFIKNSKVDDLASSIKDISDVLPPEKRNLLAYGYFSRAVDNDGNLSANKLATLISKLGKNQFESLVPDPNMRSALQNYKKLEGMNKETMTLMFNPKTGIRNLNTLALASHIGGALTGAEAGREQGHPVVGALAGLIAPSLAARYATRYLSNPSLRENLIKAMIEQKPLNTTPMHSLAQALANHLQGGQNNGS